MRSLVTLAVLSLSVTSCALLQQGLKESAEGIKPDQSVIPQGTGWHCYASSDQAWNGCWRTKEDCFSNWQKNTSEAKKNADTSAIKFGECQPALQASCLTYEEQQAQSDGSAKFVPVAECSPDSVSCEQYGKAMSSKGAMRVSSCATVK